MPVIGRQQRTPYARAKVQTGTPPVPSIIAWQISGAGAVGPPLAPNEVEIACYGVVEGLVQNGIPRFREIGSLQEASAAVWTPNPGLQPVGTILLTFPNPLIVPVEIELPDYDISFRNRWGWGLAPSRGWFVAWPPQPGEAVPTGFGFALNQFTIDFPVDGSTWAFGPGAVPQNTNTMEFGTPFGIAGNQVTWEFAGSGLNSGDPIVMAAPSNSMFSSALLMSAAFSTQVP